MGNMRSFNPKGVWKPSQGLDAKAANRLPTGWSQMAVKGPFVFISGQVGATEKAEMPLDLMGQMKLTYKNLDKCLKAAKCTWKDVVYLGVFGTDLDHEFYTVWRKVQAKYIRKPPFPSITGVGCARLTWPNQKVEIEAIAIKD